MPQRTTIDFEANIQVDGLVFQEPANEYGTLIYLWEGLEFIYLRLQEIEGKIKANYRSGSNTRVFHFLGMPEIDGGLKAQIPSFFDWYAISAFRYVRLVGMVAYKQKATIKRADVYCKEIIPEIVAYRNKIAAHIAWSTKNGDDNEAERLASIMPQISVEDGQIWVGRMPVRITKGSNSSDSSIITPWSISDIHPKLRRRYWPNLLDTKQ